jgi:isocitrate/isopropylmalate dehydrogenase
MAQAAHGSAPDIAGQDRANPVGMILSAAMLCHWLADKYDDPALRGVGALVNGAVERTWHPARAPATSAAMPGRRRSRRRSLSVLESIVDSR